MRVFFCEFVTGGGLRGEDLPPSLAREGAMMRDALARDLADLSDVDLITTHDDRVAAPAGADSHAIGKGCDAWALWAEIAASADVSWLVAPETGGALARLTGLVRSRCPVVVGPDDEAIRIGSSKRLTAERLAGHGIPTPVTWRPDDVPPDATGPFVTKPDDGAGCEAIRITDRRPPPGSLPPGHIVQRFVAGEAASLTVLRAGARTRLLAVNRQRVVVKDGAFAFRGVSVGALGDPDGRLAALADDIVQAIPGLEGLFGVDVVLGPGGPSVIEVNPRLTTAYAGLLASLGRNPATLVPPFATAAATIAMASREVEIAL
ncbi:ATP-grasp domain-containing protein [Hansschlegelia zhihuaiae]|uniref:ATP-grasp domain-containing protein n=1 Tax=Hansschlegelia zhihuaiae TaxID=405005 RepID=A0A4Q0MMD0_9HYPH|nr:ATP-grasp domain-containing protein [Hansschlegelia zhihuaiae]RXF74625.1 ATP-grasp domain-containing protein [Hansschlegelia zhihuaiae]